LDQSNSGTVNELLTTSTLFNSPFSESVVTVSSSLFTQILTANGFVDFGNTAKMLVEFSSGLTASPADPGFLSNPAFLAGTDDDDDTTAGGGTGTPNPTPIPLPAGLPLLLAALSALILTKRSKRVVA